MVATGYRDPSWQSTKLFPWMEEEDKPLSELYTDPELSYSSGKRLTDYRELFSDSLRNGERILVKGDPGIGKTIFTRKIAYDWARGQLSQFDFVFIVDSKHINPGQSVAELIIQTHSELQGNVSASTIENIMESGMRILIVFDGSDEFDIRRHPEVDEILTGRKYKNCNFIVTSQPHTTRRYENKMSSVVKIEGFSRAQAEEYVGHTPPPSGCSGCSQIMPSARSWSCAHARYLGHLRYIITDSVNFFFCRLFLCTQRHLISTDVTSPFAFQRKKLSFMLKRQFTPDENRSESKNDQRKKQLMFASIPFSSSMNGPYNWLNKFQHGKFQSSFNHLPVVSSDIKIIISFLNETKRLTEQNRVETLSFM